MATIFSVPKSGAKLLLFNDWFKKCPHGIIFPNPAIHRMGNAPDILSPRYKELFNFKSNLVSLLPLNWDQKKPFSRSGTPF